MEYFVGKIAHAPLARYRTGCGERIDTRDGHMKDTLKNEMENDDSQQIKPIEGRPQNYSLSPKSADNSKKDILNQPNVKPLDVENLITVELKSKRTCMIC